MALVTAVDDLPDSNHESLAGLTPDERVIREAKIFFRDTLDYESYARDRWDEDTRFAHGDSINGFQWPEQARSDRDNVAKPWVTINKTRQHCLIIVNEAKKNKPAMIARPLGGQATYKSGLAYNAIFRGIEYRSQAQDVYSLATTHLVEGGWAYWRVRADYVANDSDEQDIFIEPIADTMSVLLDPWIKQQDGSDADQCLIFTDVPNNQFKKLYPQFIEEMGKMPMRDPLGSQSLASWFDKETTRVAEYMRRKRTPDTLISYMVQGEKHSILESDIPRSARRTMIEGLKAAGGTTSRPSEKLELEWFLLIGDTIHEKRTYPFKYIPIIRAVAEEYSVDGKVDRPGHVRPLRDPQRMYNYWATAAIEFAALQGKTPWLVAKEAVEGQIDLYMRANLENPPVLPYRAINDDGTPIPPPQRIPPPVSAPAFMDGMKVSLQDMTFVSGQYSAMMGEPSNERSGKAINARQSQGDTATYHYIDAIARAIRYTGVVIMDMLPHVVDTKRVLFAINPDGSQQNLTIDPNAKEHFQEDQAAAQAILNPKLGKYQVHADVGPDWGTKREETFNALTILLTQAPTLVPLVGDLLLKSADFDLADEAAERLRRAVPAHILGQGPSPEVLQLQQQLQQALSEGKTLQEATVKMVEENAKLRVILRGKEQVDEIDTYEAETKRLSAVAKMVSPEELAPVIKQLVEDALRVHLSKQEQAGGQSDNKALQAASILSPNGEGSGGGNSGGVLGGRGPQPEGAAPSPAGPMGQT